MCKFRPHGTAYARELRKISDMRRIRPFLCLLLSSTLLNNPDIKMSSANAFVSHAINSAFIPLPVPFHYIVDGKKINILAFLKGSYN